MAIRHTPDTFDLVPRDDASVTPAGRAEKVVAAAADVVGEVILRIGGYHEAVVRYSDSDCPDATDMSRAATATT